MINKLKSKIRREKLLIDVGIINEGFAPLYDKSIIIQNVNRKEVLKYE